MELKTKILKWSAGLPVAMLNDKTASKIGVHPQDLISIKTLSRDCCFFRIKRDAWTENWRESRS